MVHLFCTQQSTLSTAVCTIASVSYKQSIRAETHILLLYHALTSSKLLSHGMILHNKAA